MREKYQSQCDYLILSPSYLKNILYLNAHKSCFETKELGVSRPRFQLKSCSSDYPVWLDRIIRSKSSSDYPMEQFFAHKLQGTGWKRYPSLSSTPVAPLLPVLPPAFPEPSRTLRLPPAPVLGWICCSSSPGTFPSMPFRPWTVVTTSPPNPRCIASSSCVVVFPFVSLWMVGSYLVITH